MWKKIKDFAATMVIVISLFFANEGAWGGHFLTITPNMDWPNNTYLKAEVVNNQVCWYFFK
ncbi:MAG: hypothetical protein ACM3UU_09590 [Ignavibacteriales bacterium]